VEARGEQADAAGDAVDVGDGRGVDELVWNLALGDEADAVGPADGDAGEPAGFDSLEGVLCVGSISKKREERMRGSNEKVQCRQQQRSSGKGAGQRATHRLGTACPRG
jgi:hypothetical protein